MVAEVVVKRKEGNMTKVHLVLKKRGLQFTCLHESEYCIETQSLTLFFVAIEVPRSTAISNVAGPRRERMPSTMLPRVPAFMAISGLH